MNRKDIKLTLVSDTNVSYYSGMLPGSVSKLYTDEDIMVQLGPLAAWSQAEFIQKKVVEIKGNDNKIML